MFSRRKRIKEALNRRNLRVWGDGEKPVMAPDTAARLRAAYAGEVLGSLQAVLNHSRLDLSAREFAATPADRFVTEVIVEGRDQVSGWGGGTFTAAVPAPSGNGRL